MKLDTAVRHHVPRKLRKPPRPLSDTNPMQRRERPQLGTTPIWASDGTQINVTLLSDLVVRTPIINQFFESDQTMFVGGTKGLGKTLLLRFKRYRLSDQHTRSSHGSSQSDLLFIPSDRPYVDMMTELPSITRNYQVFLSEIRNAKRLWAFSIRFSIISHVRTAATHLAQLAGDALPSILREWLSSRPVAPSVVFKQLLATPFQVLHKLLDRLEGPLDHGIREINRGVNVFINKVDQGVASLDRAGLVQRARRAS